MEIRPCSSEEIEAVLDLWRRAEAARSVTDESHDEAVGFWKAVGYSRDERVGRFVKNLGVTLP
jgi:hypothetical protein